MRSIYIYICSRFNSHTFVVHFCFALLYFAYISCILSCNIFKKLKIKSMHQLAAFTVKTGFRACLTKVISFVGDVSLYVSYFFLSIHDSFSHIVCCCLVCLDSIQHIILSQMFSSFYFWILRWNFTTKFYVFIFSIFIRFIDDVLNIWSLHELHYSYYW